MASLRDLIASQPASAQPAAAAPELSDEALKLVAKRLMSALEQTPQTVAAPVQAAPVQAVPVQAAVAPAAVPAAPATPADLEEDEDDKKYVGVLFIANFKLQKNLRKFLERDFVVNAWDKRAFSHRDLAYFASRDSREELKTVVYINIDDKDERHWLEQQKLGDWRVFTIANSSARSDWAKQFEGAKSVTKRILSRMLKNSRSADDLLEQIENATSKIAYESCLKLVAKKFMSVLLD